MSDSANRNGTAHALLQRPVYHKGKMNKESRQTEKEASLLNNTLEANIKPHIKEGTGLGENESIYLDDDLDDENEQNLETATFD